MYFQFLIEDPSGQILVERVMEKIKAVHPGMEYSCKSFHGIGGFTRRNTVKETKDGKLLNDLATYLAGFDRSLGAMGREAAVFVVIDNDDRDTGSFRNELERVAKSRKVRIDYVFCIAVEEMEAWLLGDENAVVRAYPQAKTNVLRGYVQDDICGTWELLADAIYRGGSAKLKKDGQSYRSIGTVKCEWAGNIGEFLDIHKNRSPSFQYFVGEIEKRLSGARS